MEKRYQVFVSSTFIDLSVERQHVMQALLEIDCIPTGMELFPAADDSTWGLIKRVIDTCDYYVVVVGGRYGSLSEDDISFTEKEYDYAVEIGLPVLGFVHADIGELASQRVEKQPKLRRKLEAFRSKVQKRITKYWRTSHELASAVKSSILHQVAAKDRPGWVRSKTSVFDDYEREKIKLQALEKELLTYQERLTTRERDLSVREAELKRDQQIATATITEYRQAFEKIRQQGAKDLFNSVSNAMSGLPEKSLIEFYLNQGLVLALDRPNKLDVACSIKVADVLDFIAREDLANGRVAWVDLDAIRNWLQQMCRRVVRKQRWDLDEFQFSLKGPSLESALGLLVVLGFLVRIESKEALSSLRGAMFAISPLGNQLLEKSRGVRST